MCCLVIFGCFYGILFFFFCWEKWIIYLCLVDFENKQKTFFCCCWRTWKIINIYKRNFHSQKENLNGKKFSVWAIGSLKWENMTQIWYLLKKIDGKAVCLSEKRLFVKKVNSWTTLIVYTLGSMGQAGWVFSQPITDPYKIRWVVF